MKNSKTIPFFFLLLLLAAGALHIAPKTAAAQTTGSLQVRLAQDGRPVPDTTLQLVRAASLEDGLLVFQAPFVQDTLSLESLQNQDSQALQAMAASLHEQTAGQPVSLQDEQSTGSDGTAQFENLEAGLYLLQAREPAPCGFVVPQLVLLPAVQPDGSVNWTLEAEPKISPVPSLQICKTDENGVPITGKEFAFASYADADCTRLIQEVQGDPETGLLDLPLQAGKTWIRETRAPEGYALSEEVLAIETQAPGQLWINSEPCEVTDGMGQVSFVNEALSAPAAAAHTQPVPSAKTAGTHTAARAGFWFWGCMGAAAVILAGSVWLRHRHRSAR